MNNIKEISNLLHITEANAFIIANEIVRDDPNFFIECSEAQFKGVVTRYHRYLVQK